MAVFPRGLGYVPASPPSSGIRVLEDYIRYMTDQIERMGSGANQRTLDDIRTDIRTLTAAVDDLSERVAALEKPEVTK